MKKNIELSYGTGRSIVVETCQVCNLKKLTPLLFIGFLPPVNTLIRIGTSPSEEPAYPAQWLFCPRCKLVQLGLTVDPKILFPSNYPYTSSTTKILRENFAELSLESKKILNLNTNDLVVDIGSNDGNLLSNFKDDFRVLGITPEDIGKIAIKNGIDTILDYFSQSVVNQVLKKKGKAKIITATNVFAHIENIHEVINNIKKLLKNDGVFISESHYLYSLIKNLQYDTIYHEHLRYYSLSSLKYLLKMNNLEIFYAKKIPTHGGSIRVYAAIKGVYPVNSNVRKLLEEEKETVTNISSFNDFKKRVVFSKIQLYKLLFDIKIKGKIIYGVGAPSRASTLINYVGLDDGIIDAVMEVSSSHKIGNYVPGTLIPILDESKLYKDQPDFALLLSWHIAKELMPKVKAKGFRGDFIVPLPNPRILSVS